MNIVKYPHPTLRYTAKPVRRVDADLHGMVREMFELMYASRGVGLAANQVDLPLRLFVINLTGEKGKGDELVFINPVVSLPKGTAEAEEGCLSLPGVYGPVKRPKEVKVNAYNLQGEEFSARIDGLFARAVQHELDHLDGAMFFDRMNEIALEKIADQIEEFKVEFAQGRRSLEIPSDETIAARRAEIEKKYC